MSGGVIEKTTADGRRGANKAMRLPVAFGARSLSEMR